MLLGVDDTDSLEGGCTTHVAVQIMLRLRQGMGLVPLGHPRLVRLNPTNPWKTRGNAALVLHLGLPRGEPRGIGTWGDRPIQTFPEGEDVPPHDDVLDAAWDVVQDLTWREDGRTNPGLVLSEGPTPAPWYDEALRSIVGIDQVRGRLEARGLLFRAEGTQRGLVGAAAAMAWPMERLTWELIAYRPRERWGAPRDVDPGSVVAMDQAFPSTFDSYDAETGALTMVPSSPCPVLFGIRGTEPGDLPRALEVLKGEDRAGWLLFASNQGTDDHLVPRLLDEVAPFESVAVRGTVVGTPRTIPGGHVLFDISEGGRRLDVAAYEPTKGFRNRVRDLLPGDVIVACGSVRDAPRTLNLEKFALLSLGAPVEVVKVGNPRCPGCGKSMKSIGAAAGYRCIRCGTRAAESAAVEEQRPRGIAKGWYEVPTGARRHLARPLQLGLRPDLEGMAIDQQAE
jgi:tRNA(Ile2)-agmatinylcytidine synthase